MFFSLVVCTYNPDLRILKRVLQSILNLNVPNGAKVEFILVNNNSNNGFEKEKEIQELLTRFAVVNEMKQGLSNARIMGVSSSNGDIIIFVDDDNVLLEDYLINLNKLIRANSKVKIWGAGSIKVDLIDGAEEWVKNYMLEFYQQRQLSEMEIDNAKKWKSYYPVGSGMVIEKAIFNTYAEQYLNGKLTSTGRKGNSLASGEDAQIIWSTIKNGHFVGSAPELKLIHIIPLKRVSYEYLKNLNFNLSISFYQSYEEVFNQRINNVPTIQIKSFISLFLKCLKDAKFNFKDVYKVYGVRKMWYIGYNEYLNQRK